MVGTYGRCLRRLFRFCRIWVPPNLGHGSECLGVTPNSIKLHTKKGQLWNFRTDFHIWLIKPVHRKTTKKRRLSSKSFIDYTGHTVVVTDALEIGNIIWFGRQGQRSKWGRVILVSSKWGRGILASSKWGRGILAGSRWGRGILASLKDWLNDKETRPCVSDGPFCFLGWTRSQWIICNFALLSS